MRKNKRRRSIDYKNGWELLNIGEGVGAVLEKLEGCIGRLDGLQGLSEGVRSILTCNDEAFKVYSLNSKDVEQCKYTNHLY